MNFFVGTEFYTFNSWVCILGCVLLFRLRHRFEFYVTFCFLGCRHRENTSLWRIVEWHHLQNPNSYWEERTCLSQGYRYWRTKCGKFESKCQKTSAKVTFQWFLLVRYLQIFSGVSQGANTTRVHKLLLWVFKLCFFICMSFFIKEKLKEYVAQ